MTHKPINLLLLEDQPGEALLLSTEITDNNPGEFNVTCVDRLSEALTLIETTHFDILLSDLGLPDSMGLVTVQTIATRAPAIPLVVLTGNNDLSIGHEAIKLGAQDFLLKGTSNPEMVARTLRYAILRKRLELELLSANEDLEKRIAERTAELDASNAYLQRRNRLYAVLSEVTSAILHIKTPTELFREVCRIAFETGKFKAALVIAIDLEKNTDEPMASQGLDEEFIQAVLATLHKPMGTGHDPLKSIIQTMIQERKPTIVKDMTSDPRIVLKKLVVERGLRSLAALPFDLPGKSLGILILYADTVNFFDEEEIGLLRVCTGDIGFALSHFEKDKRIDYLKHYDVLTGLANRTQFLERLKNSLSTHQEKQEILALVVTSVIQLKAINDSLGFQLGQEFLQQLTGRLLQVAGKNNIAMLGENLFVILLPLIKNQSETILALGHIGRECYTQPFQLGGTEVRVTANSGVVLSTPVTTNADSLISNAEAALDQAMRKGEQYLFYSTELSSNIASRLTLESKLREALERKEFLLHYQPKVNLRTGVIEGVEALLRWKSPELGLVQPASFIPILEETGLILQVGAWVLQQAALDHRTWIEQGLNAPRIAVNVSAVQLHQSDFIEILGQALKAGVTPPGIDLEITESMLMENVLDSIEKLDAVRRLGLDIGIDDFGTGHSSLSYLTKLPVQCLKIDRSFIIAMTGDPDSMTLVQTILSLANSLRLTVVAEGVDSEEQANLLRLLRCDQMQGYLYCRPLPFDEMKSFLAKQEIHPRLYPT